MMDEYRTMTTKDESLRERVDPYFPKGDMEIESGYPSENEAQASQKNKRDRQVVDLNESKQSYALLKKRTRVPQEARFRIFQSMGFQGNPNDALDLICLTLRSLEFVSSFSQQSLFSTTHSRCCLGLANTKGQRLQAEVSNQTGERTSAQ